MRNYDGKRFRPINTNGVSETTTETIFNYSQTGSTLTATYAGGEIEAGHLMGVVDANGNIDMCYHHRNISGQLMTGICQSVPEILENGKIHLHETWQWTCPHMDESKSKGSSILEEI